MTGKENNCNFWKEKTNNTHTLENESRLKIDVYLFIYFDFKMIINEHLN